MACKVCLVISPTLLSVNLNQSLEFVAETRILAEMKIENHGKLFFSAEKQIDKHNFFLTVHRCSRKNGNHAVNECKFASKIQR